MPRFLTPVSKQSAMTPHCSGDETLLGPSVVLVCRNARIALAGVGGTDASRSSLLVLQKHSALNYVSPQGF